ncbi:hypothetical protein IT568_11785, partial [bacterium]|nr:hypothetical protein [bacterium]
LQENYTVKDSLVSVADRLFYLENRILKRDYFNENNDLISMDFLETDGIQGIFPVNQNLLGVERLNSVTFYDVYTKDLICGRNTGTLQPAGKSFCADSYLIVFIRDDENSFVEIYEFATNSFVWKFTTHPVPNILEANLTHKFLHLLCLNQDNFIELKTYSS